MVLEARYKAEKIGYPVVGEETKESSDVIDYDFKEEQTKDISAEINANNQTTTGMATVIPGVNAPKLLEATSIISSPKAGYIQATANGSWDAAYEPGRQQTIEGYTLTNEVGNMEYKVIGNYGSEILIPADGTYQLDITYPEDGSFHYWVTRIYDTNSSGRFVTHTGTTGASHRDTETVLHDFKKGATLYAICEYYYTGSGTGSNRNPQLTMTITRLG